MSENGEAQAENVRLGENDESVVILDQTLLPNRTVYLSLSDEETMFEAIQALRVRGAPAIGIFAGFCLYVLARKLNTDNYTEFKRLLTEKAGYLESSRPTAVNLGWALSRMLGVVRDSEGLPVGEILKRLRCECLGIQQEDIRMCRKISESGLSLLRDGDGILTHCNAGPLATSRYGTALGPLLLGRERGMNFHVFADETRPLLQGARLTAYELGRAGIDVTLICDSMAGEVMKKGLVNACFVGCDRIAANGDTANKIGTSGVSVLAHYYGIPFYVLGPTSTIDRACEAGEQIEIEMRDPGEIREKYFREPMAPQSVKCFNPAFDVTSHELITAIVTEKGVCRPPFAESLRRILESV